MLQNLELVSKFQTIAYSCRTYSFMKLSSTSLIAATLAAITCSAIATPVPLHARALQQLNSFDIEIYNREAEVALVEREVYGEPVDNLFTRQPPTRHVEDPDTIPTKAKKVLGIKEADTQMHILRIKEPKEKKRHVLFKKIKGIMCFPYM